MIFKSKLYINKKKISFNSPTYFIADIAANHDGNFDRVERLVYLAKECEADAIKFQHFLAPKIVSDFGFKNFEHKTAHQKKWKKSVYEIYEKYSFNRNWDEKIYELTKKLNIQWMTTPYDIDALEKTNKFSKAFKIGSGDITWLDFIEAVSKKKKPIILSTGASDIKDVTNAVKVISKFNNKLCIMQCNTNYENERKNFHHINLRVLNLYKKKFKNIILGLSDHTEGHSTVLGAVTLGARIIEKHFTDDNKRNGPDHYFSMNPNSWKEMIKRTRELEDALGYEKKIIEQNEQESVLVQRRCIRLNKKLIKGSIISIKDLDYLRPAPKNSLSPADVKKILNKKLKKEKQKGSEINLSDVS